MKKRQMTTSQPESWIEAFQRQASLEGMTFSEWVGQACLRSLPFSDESDWSQDAVLVAHGLSQRVGRGRAPGSGKEVAS